MIARLLISPSYESLALHLRGVNVNHPDTLYFKAGEKLGIAEARKIKEHFSLKPYSAKGRTAILEDASVLTTEAQNALLKTIEELPKEAVLILRTTSDANLLPTIVSRCEVIRIENRRGLFSDENGKLRMENYDENIEKLLETTMERRFEFIEKLKNKEEFLKALLVYFHQDAAKNSNFLQELILAEKWAKQNVNIRAILEYLMLVMPAPK